MDANGLKDGRRFFSRDFTVETWVFLADTGANDYQGAFIQGMVWFDGAGTFTRVGYELGVEPNAAGVVSVPYISFNTLADKRYKVSAASSLPKNRWVHLAGVYDHARNALSLYIDGLLEQSLQVLEESSSTFGISKGGMLTLALDNGGAESFADNLWLDEVRVWGVPRTSDEVADNRSRLIDPIQLTSAAIYTNVEPNALFAYYTFDDGGTSAEDLCRRAKSSLLGYAYPHDTNVITFLNQEYFYGDRAFALDSDDLKGAGNAFTFDGNRVSPVIGFVDAERGEFDSDRDGLPDSWEIVHELNPFKTNTPDHDQIEGYDPLWATTEGPAADWSRDLELPVGDGLNNLYEYWAHTNPRKIDTDEDGLYDGEEDFEGDGLPNRVEVLINSRPDLADTDDDEHGDSREQVDQTSPILSLSPEKNLLVRFDGQPGSYLDIFDRSTLRLNSWTLEAKVLPLTVTNLANGQGAAIVRRAVQETVNGLLAANFELRVVRVGTNLTAEARYVYVDNGGTGRVVKATGDPAAVERDRLSVQTDPTDPYPSSELVHLAATYDYNSGILSLYINGSLAARNTTALSRPPSNGRGPRSFVRVGEGFRGFVDDVRLWSGAATAAELLTRKDIDLTGNEAGLIAYYRVDDGGWQSHWTLPAILSVEADPGTVTTNIGDRYIVDTAAVGAWVGHDGDIAEFSESGIWVYTVPEDGSRVYNAAAAAVFEYDETLDSWSAAALPTLVRSVRYAAAPGTPKEGDTWRVGGNIFTRETGVTYSEAAPAKLFQEGAMLIGAAAGGDFAWWVSRDEFYRYDAGLAAWKRWGKAVQWLAEARARVKRLLATQAALFALPDTPVVGNTYAVVAPASFYTYMGGPWASADSWLIEPMNDGDRYISEFSGNVYDYDAGGPTMITIASATTDGGGLYLYVRSEGAAWRSDGAEWKRWGFVPTTEDFATTQDWLNQWARAAKLSGGGFFTKLATVVSSLDSDGDGLPDDWEIAHGLDPYDPTGDNGALGDPDGDGLNNLNEYLTGNHPNNPDTDGNGVWDGQEDYDKDGLSNNYEQDYTFTRLDRVDTDDDYLTDWEEVTGYDFTNTAVFAYAGERRPDRLSNPLRSLDPPQQMSGKFNGDGRLLVPHQTRHSLRSWTVHAWVWPSNLADGVVIRRAVTNEYLKRLAVNYELGVRTNAVGALIPYGRYIGLTTNGLPVEVRVDGTQTNEIVGGQQATVQIPSEQWTHLAASYDHEAHTLRLYINGDLASYRTEAFEPWGMGLYEGLDYKSELTVGGGNRTSATNVTQGFEGYIDEAVVMAGALEEDSVKSAATTPLSELAGVRAASVPESGTIKMLPIDEALMYEHHPDQLMVRFKPEVVPAQVPGLSAGLGIVSLHKYSLVPVYQMEITDGVTLSQKLAQVRSDPNVLYAEPNYRVQIDRTPNDPSFGMLWGLHNTGEGGGTADADIDAPEAWSRATGSRDIIVAVIDTGIDYNHVDLADNMWKNTGEIPTNGIDDDANGYVDDVYGYDFYNKDADPMDDHSHGTHCAGTIGAVGNNGVGVVGVNWRVKLMALKFLSSFGGGWDADAISAIEYAWRNGAKISNNSWGGYGYSQSLYDAIRAAELNGHLFVSSAGNYGLDNDVWPQYPASFDLNNIIAVAASDRKDEMPLWSNYGLTSVDLAAPGASIYSTILGGGYSSFDGTSMSAPHVAGVAALIASINPDLGYEQLKQYILDGVDEKAAFADKMLTDGRLNASKAVGGAGAMLLYLPFDDYGRTAEDFTKAEDWKTDWAHAGVFFRSGFSTNSYLDRQTDSDGDGMPDWWEIAVGLNPFSATGNDGHDGDGDGDGLKNYYEYLANTSPSAADTDRDGVSDFTEDPDNDGLTNGQEQDLGTLPRQADTDDDGINDNVELMFGNDPLDAFNPDLPRAYQFNGTGRLRVRSEQSSEVSTNWTVEAWVRPTNSTVSGIILRRAEKYPFGGIRWINYELGLANGIPYIRYVYRQTNITEVRVNALKAIGTNWTHLAGVHDAETRQLRLYVDGKRVNYAYPAELPPMPRYGTFETVIGGGDLGGGGASNGFRGAIDAVRMWTYPRSGVDIQDNRGVLFPELVAGVVDSSRGPVRLFNFDDGGVYAENSAFTNDWLTGWQHAAQV
ncbi:MAG: S8 family serine peptidase, partial [Verrucomicrobia bacterium]|nr:S8 family serine peptidase [Verrucomicrobiota bacterium]